MEAIEAARGQWAAWILIALGFTYGVWGVHRAIRNRPHGYLQLALTVTVFGAATIVTMLSCVWILQRGVSFLPLQPVERWSHALAGFAVFACGGAMAWLGL